MSTEKVKCLIIGSGPAGYTAAIYTGRANIAPVLYEGLQPGGQLTITTEVENFPGYPEGISGTQLMEDLRKQAERFGADIRNGIATSADLSKRPYRITIDDEKVIEAETVIISTGATAKYLGLEDEQKYAGMGVMKYYNSLRIQKAMELMQNGKNISETSEILNFSSQQYFTEVFKRQCGMTPSEHKKKYI